MAKAMTTYVKGIKCDNPECDYKDTSVKYEDYPKWVDKPCPCCGSNLLTKHDYEVTKFLVKMSSVFGKINVPDEKVDTVVHVKLNGTDNVDFDVNKIDGKTGSYMDDCESADIEK